MVGSPGAIIYRRTSKRASRWSWEHGLLDKKKTVRGLIVGGGSGG